MITRHNGHRNLRCVCVWAWCVSAAWTGWAQSPAEDTPEDRSDPWMVTIGGEGRDGETEGLLEVMIPLVSDENGLFFVAPRGALTDHSEKEMNLGFGVRRLVGGGARILGLNAYLDHRITASDATFTQLGLGGEVLGRWVDARINGYYPLDRRELVYEAEVVSVEQETVTQNIWDDPYAVGHGIYQDYTEQRTTIATTTTRYFEQYEYARAGGDGEVGLRLPLPGFLGGMEPRVYFGGYYFNGEYGQEDIRGWKARLEIRVGDHFCFDGVIYDNDDLTGSDYAVGVRASFPFDPARLARGQNPFKDRRASPDGPRRRLTETVMRDLHVRTARAEFMEDARRTTVRSAVKSSRRRRTATLAADVMFVDGDRGDDAGDGAAERPLSRIQAAVDRAFGLKNVYVFGVSQPYHEEVVIRDGVNLWGGVLYGSGHRTFGSLPKPTIAVALGQTPVVFQGDGVLSGFLLDYGDGLPPYDTMNTVVHNGTWLRPARVVLPGGGVSYGSSITMGGYSPPPIPHWGGADGVELTIIDGWSWDNVSSLYDLLITPEP